MQVFSDPNGSVSWNKRVAIDRRTAGVNKPTRRSLSRLNEEGICDRNVDRSELRLRELSDVRGVKRGHMHDGVHASDRCPSNMRLTKIAYYRRPFARHPVNALNAPSMCRGRRCNSAAECTRASRDQDSAEAAGARTRELAGPHRPIMASYCSPVRQSPSLSPSAKAMGACLPIAGRVSASPQTEPRVWEPGRMDEALLDEPGSAHALLFDLGGVVIGFDFGRAFRLWALRAGCDPATLEERFSLDDAYERHERGEIPASAYFTALRQSLRIELSDEEFIEGWNDVYLGLVPGIDDLLSIARQRLPLFAFTNSNPTHKSTWERLYASDLEPFETIFVSSDLGYRKPEPEAFNLVTRNMRFDPSEVLFFDDSPDNVEGARSVGMQAVVVHSSADVRRALSQVGIEVELKGS